MLASAVQHFRASLDREILLEVISCSGCWFVQFVEGSVNSSLSRLLSGLSGSRPDQIEPPITETRTHSHQTNSKLSPQFSVSSLMKNVATIMNTSCWTWRETAWRAEPGLISCSQQIASKWVITRAWTTSLETLELPRGSTSGPSVWSRIPTWSRRASLPVINCRSGSVLPGMQLVQGRFSYRSRTWESFCR